MMDDASTTSKQTATKTEPGKGETMEADHKRTVCPDRTEPLNRESGLHDKGVQPLQHRGKQKSIKATPPKIRAIDRTSKAIQMRREGASYEAIGKALGMSTSGAWRATQTALHMIVKETAETAEVVRGVELMRLDVMVKAIWPKVIDGDENAIKCALKITELRAKLLGLYAPTQTKVELETKPRVHPPHVQAIIDMFAGMSEEEYKEFVAEGNCVTTPKNPAVN